MQRSRNSHGEMHQPCSDAGKFRFAISSVNRTARLQLTGYNYCCMSFIMSFKLHVAIVRHVRSHSLTVRHVSLQQRNVFL